MKIVEARITVPDLAAELDPDARRYFAWVNGTRAGVSG